MNVQHLKLWIVRMARGLLRVWRPSVERAGTAEPRAAQSVGSPGSDLAAGRWLDDSRRLRARAGARPRPIVTAVSREQLRQIFTDPRWASAYDAALPPRPPRAPKIGDPFTPQPSGESAESRPTVPSRPAAASEDAEEQATLGRRLTFIRDLVRRGIYNEGFDAAQLPDQYRPRLDDQAE